VSNTPITLVWFRRDLRLRDNPTLTEALASGNPVKAIFIHDPDSVPGGASRWYLHQSLLSLQKELAAIGVPLHCLVGRPEQRLASLVREWPVERVCWSRVLEPRQATKDEAVRQMLQAERVAVAMFHGDTLLPPERVRKKDGTAFKVFTPFWRHVQDVLHTEGVRQQLGPVPDRQRHAVEPVPAEVQRLQLLDNHPWHRKLHTHWQPGEAQAHDLFDSFLEQAVSRYDEGRDFPAEPATSRLSPALHFGEISAAHLYDTCRMQLAYETDEGRRRGIHRFLSEVGWREFARHVLHAFPHTAEQSLNPRFERPGAWETDQDDRLLRAWQRGETGIALVDAGMRELWETGWMHNRVRMVAASLLTKNLGIHWRRGAEWFWDTLVDADLASNTLGWQWVAGCGTDAAPYYRIFNPRLQAEKFDPRGGYIRRWLGDGIRPPALVDLKVSRERALERYRLTIRRADR